MKISNKNYPILEKLHRGSLGEIPILQIDMEYILPVLKFFVKNWLFYRQHFIKEINIISEPFANASFEAQDRILDLYKDIVGNDLDDFIINGTYVEGDIVYMLFNEFKKGSENSEVAFFVFDKKGTPLAFLFDSSKYKIFQRGWVSKTIEASNDELKIKAAVYNLYCHPILFYIFKKFAQVETKAIASGKQIRDINCKYINHTNFDVMYLDSTWFTNLVKSDEFKVKGHFRLQPKKKDGRWTKELIWIKEFKKNGYTKKLGKYDAKNKEIIQDQVKN